MAEAAFALSPLSASAHAVAPSDADYEVIREAFMETARGRWFLNEYAKRNRNADTAMVLEAVARIEQSMAAAKAEQASPESVILDALHGARRSIEGVFAEPLFDDALGHWRKSSRIIQEIAWALRETGSDPRICDILERQVRQIETGCDELPVPEVRAKVLGVLDDAIGRLSPDAMPACQDIDAPDPAANDTAAKDKATAIELTTHNENAGPTATTRPEAATPVAPATGSAAEPAIANDDAAPHDMVAMAEERASSQPAAAGTAAEISPVPTPTHPPVSDTSPEPALSLGESLLARGLVKQPLPGRPDPLAPIRRMSQAERIAFFS